MLRLSPSSANTFSNKTCPYCGVALTRRSATKEHVVGRRFVPLGSLQGSWNLILQACRACNQHKSDLEDDISAIAMAFHAAGLSGLDGEVYRREVERKWRRTISRKTGKPVADSAEKMSVDLSPFPGVQITGHFHSPPQFDDDRTLKLARLQMLGFFYMLTYDEAQRRGYAWRGNFAVLDGAIKADWGNPVQRAFAKAVSAWDYRLLATIANGSYRTAIRKHPDSDCWSWAVEWNECYRMIGFFGDHAVVKECIAAMPPIPVNSIHEAENSWIRYRIEERLPETEEHDLFTAPHAV